MYEQSRHHVTGENQYGVVDSSVELGVENHYLSAFVFAGQGSQYFGMGRWLHENDTYFRDSFDTLDTMFGDHGIPRLGARVLGAGPRLTGPMEDIELSHPGIVLVELALFDALAQRGIGPDLLVGASLGEFAALAAGGGVDREDLVAVLADHVRLLAEECPRGGMLAVVADPKAYSERLVDWRSLELAAVNAARHFVVSGPVADIEHAAAALTASGVLCQRLPIEYAFHSSLIDPVRERFEAGVALLDVGPTRVPLVSCATAAPATGSVSHLWDVVRAPILWRDTVGTLERTHGPQIRYVDLSPSGSMNGFLHMEFGAGIGDRSCAVTGPFLPDRPVLDVVAEIGLLPSTDEARGTPMSGHEHHDPSEPAFTTAVLFPGQGSQQRGMGKDLFGAYPDLVREADDVLGFSIERLCLDDPDGHLARTDFAQPALFVVNALSWHRFLDETGTDPGRVLLAGHSLGEICALYASGALTFRDGVRVVRTRGLAMAEARDGGMAAVIGLSEDEVRRLLQERGFDDIDVANINSAEQIVVSGPSERVPSVREAVVDAGGRFAPLRVSGAFHSRYMAPAQAGLARFLADVPFGEPAVPVLSNVTARPYADDPRSLLVEQLVRPVRWLDLMHAILERGITDIREVGPGTTLTNLTKKIRDTWAAKPPARPVLDRADETPARAVGADTAALGSADFRRDHGVAMAYVCGAMYRGIASEALVRKAAEHGILAYYGAGGLPSKTVAAAVTRLKSDIPADRSFGVNLVHDPLTPSCEEEVIDICLDEHVRRVEASAFVKVSPALVRYRVTGLSRAADGGVEIANKVMAKVSRPEVAADYLAPPDPAVVADLVRRGVVTGEQAELARRVPMADDLCAEGDSGGHTDRRNPVVLFPAIAIERDRARVRHGYRARVRVGVAGGIGTPHAAAAAFAMGADFVMAGSINLCTVESGMSDLVKDILQTINIHDTDYAPAGDMFEFGAEVQVVRKGMFFPARARKLYQLYRSHSSLDELDADVRELLEKRYFNRSLDQVWEETKEHFARRSPDQIQKALADPRHKMALVFRWYFGHSQRAAMEGVREHKLDFQVHCGSALGAFNQWVSGTPLEPWRTRHVDDLAHRIMAGAGDILAGRSSTEPKR